MNSLRRLWSPTLKDELISEYKQLYRNTVRMRLESIRLKNQLIENEQKLDLLLTLISKEQE